jgi:hypothetical protein
MTEAEWLECTDPQKMLEFLIERASERKLRLFLCIFCREIADLSRWPEASHGVHCAELFADDQTTLGNLLLAHEKVCRIVEYQRNVKMYYYSAPVYHRPWEKKKEYMSRAELVAATLSAHSSAPNPVKAAREAMNSESLSPYWESMLLYFP